MGGITPGELAAVADAWKRSPMTSWSRCRARTSAPAAGATCAGDAGWPAQVGGADDPAAGRGGALPGAAPLGGGLAVGLAAGPPPPGRAPGGRVGADGVGGGRHRLPQRRRALGRGAAPVLGHAGQDGQLSAGVSVNAVTEHASCPLDWRLFVPERWDRTPWRSGGRPAGCPARCGTGPSGSWRWTCWMSWSSGTCDRRCWSPMPAMGRSASSARAGRPPDPLCGTGQGDTSAYPSRCSQHAPYSGRGRRHGRATASGPARSSSWPWPPDPRRAWSSSGGGVARACSGLGSWPCGSAGWHHPTPPGRRRADSVGWELPVRWLLAEWPTDKPEPVKYWLSNLPATTPMVELVRLGKLRWRIEQDYRDSTVPWAGPL